VDLAVEVLAQSLKGVREPPRHGQRIAVHLGKPISRSPS
jgi:hypothetical protein